jgi:trehalose/maltose hydrolase-like predicted phosphorylase
LLGKLNTVDDGVIDEKDMAGALDVDAYKKNMKTLINTITDIEHKNFSLPLTKALQEEFFADLLRQESEENYKEKVERGGSSRTPMSAGMVYQLEQEQKTADATIKALNSGATTIGTFSGPNVQLVGELWVFKNEGSIAGTIPKDTPKAELDQAIMNHMTGTIGKYTVTIPEPE